MRIAFSAIALLFMTSCVSEGAPTLELFGAYFPDWLLYGVLGVVFSIITRVVMIKAQMEHLLPFQLLLCSSLGFGLAALLWLI